jgi:hypothetical protein
MTEKYAEAARKAAAAFPSKVLAEYVLKICACLHAVIANQLGLIVELGLISFTSYTHWVRPNREWLYGVADGRARACNTARRGCGLFW